MKKLLTLTLITILLVPLSGCLKRDTLEDIDIYTSIYPTEYITNRLYGDHSTVYSIYPDGVNVDTYELTEKQIEDYSKASLYIFNGLGKDKDYVKPMFSYNKKIKIIDASMTMEYTNGIEELWLDPSNFLMLSQNIRNGLQEYITNGYLQQRIEEKYEELKVEVSTLDANIRLMAESSTNKTMVVSSNALKFLEKYGINVISIDEDDVNDKVMAEVSNLIQKGTINYIYTLDYDNENKYVLELTEDNKVSVIKLARLDNISTEDRNMKKDYISIMYENLDLIKNELYD